MIADIISEIKSRDIEVHIHRFAKRTFGSAEWQIEMTYMNSSGDELKVKRRNADFEAAIIAAYEALRQGMTEGMLTALPAPETSVRLTPDGIPF